MRKNKTSLFKEELGRTIFFSIILLLAVTLFFNLPRLTVPFILSYILYLIVSPLVPTLIKLGISKNISIFIVFTGIMFTSIYPLVKITPSVKNELERLQYYIPKVENFIQKKYFEAKESIKKVSGYELEDHLIDDALAYAEKVSRDVILSVPNFLASALEWLFIVPLFLFFFLKDGNRFYKMILNLAPNAIFERVYYITHQFNKKLGDYIFAKFIEASIVGLIITTGLLILDVRFAFLLGIVAAVTNIIPYVGPILGTAPGLIMAMVEYGVGTQFGAIVILYSAANIIDLALVFPILVSKIVDLHPIVVVASVILGSQFLGLTGMIVSIPFAAALKLVVEEVYSEIYNRRN